MNPKISVIIPTYNRPDKLENTLKSLFNQTFENWECIIIDDNSEKELFESSKRIIRKDKRLHLIKKPLTKLKGPSASRNFGLTFAKGEYIQFFDDDDEMYSNMLEEKFKKIKCSNFDVVVSPLDIFDVEETKIIAANRVFSNNLLKDYILGNISWYVSGPLWKKDFLKERFDEEIQTLDDWDFNLRNLYNNPKVVFIENSLQRYNRYGIEKTLSTKRYSGGMDQSRSVFLVYKKHFNKLLNEKMLTLELKDCLLVRIVFLLRQCLIRNNKNSRDIFNFLVLKSHSNKIKLLKICIGFYSYKIFNMGYRFVKY